VLTPGASPHDCSEDGLICQAGDCVSPLSQIPSCQDISLPEDPFTVIAPRIEETTLFVPVNYSGGCAEHIFSACHESFREGEDDLRVQINIGHNANGDSCEGIRSEEVVFDLTQVIEAWNGQGDQFEITVSGFRGVLNYR
jgi:hypothetical protein